jgi:hypothetical protein
MLQCINATPSRLKISRGSQSNLQNRVHIARLTGDHHRTPDLVSLLPYKAWGTHWLLKSHAVLPVPASHICQLFHTTVCCLSTLCCIYLFYFLGGTGAWNQGLHLEPLHQPFFCEGFFWYRVSQKYLPRLASSCDPPDLCLLSS